jgi:salicylate hydroxylase
MTYAMNSGEKFNLVLSHVDHTHPNTWTEKLAKDHIQAEFAGWDPLYVPDQSYPHMSY